MTRKGEKINKVLFLCIGKYRNFEASKDYNT